MTEHTALDCGCQEVTDERPPFLFLSNVSQIWEQEEKFQRGHIFHNFIISLLVERKRKNIRN